MFVALTIAPISGKSLGGSSSINFYVFSQPPASDIDGMTASHGPYPPLIIVLLCDSDRKARKPRLELGDLPALLEKERAVCPFQIPVQLCLLLTV